MYILLFLFKYIVNYIFNQISSILIYSNIFLILSKYINTGDNYVRNSNILLPEY